jgi:2-deoxy-D-gluconate 3-dehydrogenase
LQPVTNASFPSNRNKSNIDFNENNFDEYLNFLRSLTNNYCKRILYFFFIRPEIIKPFLRKPVADHPDEYWDEVIVVNQTTPFILARELGKEMLKRQKGKIIFTASLLTFQGGINVPGYTASKSAIGGLTKAFANEWASKGINVNAIAPGYIATDNTAALQQDESRSKSILERIPAGRWGKPDDFKGPVVLLASSASDYMHGSILIVDGGWMGR